jgi:uncharacterized membrane protein AbrB (regulator of aidB expression)
MLFRFGPIVLVVALITVACAKTELPTSPTDTGAPPPSANQPPVINSIAGFLRCKSILLRRVQATQMAISLLIVGMSEPPTQVTLRASATRR